MKRYRFIADNTNYVKLFDCKLDKKIGIVYYITQNNMLMLPKEYLSIIDKDKCFYKRGKNYYLQIGRCNIQN